MRVMTFVGTRPELIKLSRVIPALDANFEHALVHTGQNWNLELKDVFFKELKLREPDLQLDLSGAGPWTPATAVGRIMEYCDQILRAHKPDAVLILGDTNSCVAAAYAAKRNYIKLFHMEAGNRCFDDRTPEEINRRVVDTLADVNMPYTEIARRNLIASGCASDRIVRTGSPMREVIQYYAPEIAAAETPPARSYYVVSAHREENVDDIKRVGELVDVINRLAAFGRVIVTVHPRLRPQLAKFCFCAPVELHKPFGFLQYAKLQENACCVISDSGTLAEEAAILGFPAVSIRYSSERPEAIEEANMIRCDLDPSKIMKAVTLAQAYGRIHRKLPWDYQPTNVSVKVVHTLASFA